MKLLRLTVFLLGTGLLLVTGLGEWTSLGRFQDYELREWEAFDPELVPTLTSLSAISDRADQSLAEEALPKEVMEAMQGVISLRFSDGEGRHNLFSNWILGILGKLHPSFLHVWSSDLLAEKGRSMHCDQASYMLLTLALDRGIQARHVGLEGHVVMEAWYDEGWHLYDPDMEVIPEDADGKVLSVDELAANESLLGKYYSRYPEMIGIVGSQDDNTFVSEPVGGRFDWKGDVLATFETLAEVAKWMMPVMMIAVAVFPFRGRNRVSASST